MSMPDADLTPLTRNLLYTLLDRAEQPGRAQVVRVRLSVAQHPAYFSQEDATPRRETNAALTQLAVAGIVRLRWQRWEEDNWLHAIDLVPEQRAVLYTLLGRQPRDQQTAALLALLDQQPIFLGWHATFLEWVRQQLVQQRSPAPLNREDPALNADLLCALAGIAALRTPTLERSLSTRLFGDSKRLEQLRSAVLSVLRRHAADAASYAGDNWALLRAHGLDRVPEYVPLAGPLVLVGQHGAPLHDLSGFCPSVALSAAYLRTAGVAACAASMVITVENATSFSELIAIRPADALVVFIGGFASPTVVALLRAIRAFQPGIALLHWGDLDAGGLRILLHLRSQLGAVAALAMDATTLHAQLSHTRPLRTSDRQALAALRAELALSDCHALIDAMLQLDRKLEQEALTAKQIVAIVAQASKHDAL